MKLTEEEIKRVTELYSLGQFRSIRYFPGGLISHNFDIKTTKGNFVVRKLGYKIKDWWENQKRLEFAALPYLIKKGFPYQIPHFIKNKNGEYISKIRGSLFEVYPKIEGEMASRKMSNRKVDDKKFKEFAKAIALYHKYISGINLRGLKRSTGEIEWILKEYEKMKKLKPVNDVNRLALKNIGFFEDTVKGIDRGELMAGKAILTHGDLGIGNTLFDGDRLVGIIDFENLRFDSRERDFKFILGREKDKRRWKMFFREYRKYNNLPEGAEKRTMEFIILDRCASFWWATMRVEKRPDLKYKILHDTIQTVRRWKKQNKV